MSPHDASIELFRVDGACDGRAIRQKPSAVALTACRSGAPRMAAYTVAPADAPPPKITGCAACKTMPSEKPCEKYKPCDCRLKASASIIMAMASGLARGVVNTNKVR